MPNDAQAMNVEPFGPMAMINPFRNFDDAVKEANRDGAPPIDLIDGESLADKLKELRLGIKVEMIEQVTVDADWFKAI